MDFANDTAYKENMTNLTSRLDGEITAIAALVPVWARVSLIVFILVAMVIGIPGNSLVMAMLLKLPRKTSTDIFIIFIALVDVLSLIISGFTHTVTVTPTIWTSISSATLCRFHIYFSHFVSVQSALLIACVGVDRYVKTCKPHSVLFTARSAFITCLVATVVSAIFNISHFFTTKLNQNGNCVLDTSRATLRLSMYGVVMMIHVIASVTLCVLYSRIACVIRRRVKIHPQVNVLSKETNTSKSNTFFLKSKPNKLYTIRSRSKVLTSNFQGSVNNTEKTTVLGQTSKQTDQPKQAESTMVPQTTTTQMFSISQKQDHPRAGGRVQKIHVAPISHSWKQANNTTKIMFAITVVYVISATFPVIALAVLTSFASIKNHEVGRIVTYFILRLYMVNNFANPIFYCWLSSKFRKSVRDNLKCNKH